MFHVYLITYFCSFLWHQVSKRVLYGLDESPVYSQPQLLYDQLELPANQ